jgi:hypothetical protein
MIDKNVEFLHVGDPANDKSMGLAEHQPICGIGQFAGLYNTEDMATVTASAGVGGIDNFRRSGSTVHVIKPELHCLGKVKRIIVGGNSGGLTLAAHDVGGQSGRQGRCQPNQRKIPSCQD